MNIYDTLSMSKTGQTKFEMAIKHKQLSSKYLMIHILTYSHLLKPLTIFS